MDAYILQLAWLNSKCGNQQREKQNEKASEIERDKTKMQGKTRKSCNTAFLADQKVYLLVASIT